MKVYNDLAVVILAAGKGTRMKSDLAKVLHKVDSKSMVVHVIGSANKIAPENLHVVIGHQADKVKEEINQFFSVSYSIQKQLLGTGDAVKSALPNIKETTKHVLVLSGDVPLIQPDTLNMLVDCHVQTQNKVSVLATIVDNPTGYGRIITNSEGQLICIKEEVDASDEERQIQTINTGIYCFERTVLLDAIQKLKPDNNQAEYYLTDVIEIAKNNDEKIGSVVMEKPDEVMGVNTLEELSRAQQLLQEMGK